MVSPRLFRDSTDPRWAKTSSRNGDQISGEGKGDAGLPHRAFIDASYKVITSIAFIFYSNYNKAIALQGGLRSSFIWHW